MTGDDLRAIGTWVDWRGNPPKVTIPAATRDALADLIDAAKDLLAECDADDHNNMVGGLPHAERCQECGEHWPCPTARWADAAAALDQEAPT